MLGDEWGCVRSIQAMSRRNEEALQAGIDGMATTLLIKRTDLLSPALVRDVLVAVSVATAVVVSTEAIGQALRDPMQPPAASPAESAGGPVQPASSGLQIVRSSGGKRMAVIDGAEVRVGTKIAGSTVVALSENSATLRDENGQLTLLSMYPGVEKKPVATATEAVVKRPAGKTNKKNHSQ